MRDQGTVLHLDQTYHYRTSRGDHREDLTLLIFRHILRCRLFLHKHLSGGRYISGIPDGFIKYIVKSHLADTLHNIDPGCAVFKLREDRRAYDRHLDFSAGSSQTLLKRVRHGDLCMVRAYTDTLRAVDTADIVDRRLSAAHTDRLRRTAFTAGSTSDTQIPYQ